MCWGAVTSEWRLHGGSWDAHFDLRVVVVEHFGVLEDAVSPIFVDAPLQVCVGSFKLRDELGENGAVEGRPAVPLSVFTVEG